jgi:putative NADH-flavin reductase
MMKLLVLGATGGVGREIISQALTMGHTAVALVRSAARLNGQRDGVCAIEGDLLDEETLRSTLDGCDAVLSGFGPRLPLSPDDSDLLARFAATLTSAMANARVRRLIVVTTAFLFCDSVVPPAYLIGRLFFRRLVDDAAEMERIIKHSDLAWMIVRPPQLTDAPGVGKYRLGKGRLPAFGFRIARADVAKAMLRIAEADSYEREIVGVSG